MPPCPDADLTPLGGMVVFAPLYAPVLAPPYDPTNDGAGSPDSSTSGSPSTGRPRPPARFSEIQRSKLPRRIGGDEGTIEPHPLRDLLQ